MPTLPAAVATKLLAMVPALAVEPYTGVRDNKRQEQAGTDPKNDKR
jgi:hypothetical protein